MTTALPALLIANDLVTIFNDLTLIIDSESFGLCAADLGRALTAKQIDRRRHYHTPIHRQKTYAHLPQHRELPVTDEIADRALTSPTHGRNRRRQTGSARSPNTHRLYETRFADEGPTSE